MLKTTRAAAVSVAIALLAGTIVAPHPVAAQSAIRMLVNDQPITSYAVSQRSKLNRLTGGKGGEKAALDELVNEAIQQTEAKRRGISIPDAQLDAAVAQIAKQVKLSPKQLAAALGQQGIQIQSLRDRIRAQITWSRLVQAKVRSSRSVGERDITAQILARGDQDVSRTIREFMLQQIIFVVPRGSAQGAYAKRRQEAESFRSRFPGCDGALPYAQTFKGVVVKPMGRRDTTQITGPLGDELMKTAVGATTKPQVTENGVEMLAVCAMEDVASDAGARAEIQSELSSEEAKKVADDYMAELKAKAKIEQR